MTGTTGTGLFLAVVCMLSFTSVPVETARADKPYIKHNPSNPHRTRSTPRYQTAPRHRYTPRYDGSRRYRTDRVYRVDPRYRIPKHRVKPGPRVYYPRGYKVRTLPKKYSRIYVRTRPYYYSSGLFYSRSNGSYVVIRAPIGARIRTLPYGYVRFYIGGIPYFYVNYVYYSWLPDAGMYVVVDRPDGADAALARVATDELIIYPKRGQSDEQREQDRMQCHRWAMKETGFDPGVPDEDRNLYNRYRKAMIICLEARGYAVK